MNFSIILKFINFKTIEFFKLKTKVQMENLILLIDKIF